MASDIQNIPAPWDCKCSVFYWFLFSLPAELPENVYDPLEAGSPTFSDPERAGQFHGGLGMAVFIIRYKETPVGPYDEMILIPGFFDTPFGSKKTFNKRHIRVCRAYVSAKSTAYNGRKNWNIPKHLARFSFTPQTSEQSHANTLKIEVFPPDPSSSVPFFSATVRPLEWVPSFPLSTRAVECLYDLNVVNPPLPASDDPEHPELCGTDFWTKTLPYLYSPKATFMWVDQKSPISGDRQELSESDALLGSSLDTWWPDIKLWRVGLALPDATFRFGEPEVKYLDAQRNSPGE